jgi:hypothetical protein
LFGFRPWGECHDWKTLIKKNHLLSLYGVKYILVEHDDANSLDAEDYDEYREKPIPDGDNLLKEPWATEQSRWAERFGVTAKVQGSGVGQTITLKTPFMFWPSQAWLSADLRGVDGYLRLSFDARAPDGGAAGFLRAEILPPRSPAVGLTVEAEQVGPQWRHFEWVTADFTIVDEEICTFRLFTLSERPIEVRNISLRPRGKEPIDMGKLLAPHGDRCERVYNKLVELPPVNPGDSPVAIYQNMLWRPIKPSAGPVPTNEELEAVKYPPPGAKLESLAVPDISLRPVDNPAGLMWGLTLPAVGLYVLVVIVAVAGRRS